MSAEALQKRYASEVEKFKAAQKDMLKGVKVIQKLEAQLSENKMVKEEFDLLKDDGNIYKLIGPALVKQDLQEAKQTVEKRIEYISSEMKSQEGHIKECEKKMETHKEAITKFQQQFQQAQVKAAMKAPP